MRPKFRLDVTTGWFCAVLREAGIRRAQGHRSKEGRKHWRRRRTSRLVESFADGLQPRLELGVLLVHLLVRVEQERFEVLDPLVPRNELAFGERNVPLQGRVLVDKLWDTDSRVSTQGINCCTSEPGDWGGRNVDAGAHLLLHDRELVEVARQKIHLALLRLAVRVLGEAAVVLASLVQRDLEFNHLAFVSLSARPVEVPWTNHTHYLFASVLQVSHQTLLHRVKVGQLLGHGLVLSLEVLCRFLQVPAAFDTGRCDLECSLQAERSA
jgi:hypothetical protein